MNCSAFTSFHHFVFSIFLFSNYVFDFFTFNKYFLLKKTSETWDEIGLLPSFKLEEIKLILFFKSCIIQIFVNQICMNSLLYTVKLVESYKLYHTNRAWCKSGTRNPGLGTVGPTTPLKV